MKKWMRKLAGWSLALVFMLGMMMPLTALADGEVCTVTGIPTTAVKIGDTVSIQLQVNDPDGNWSDIRYMLEGPFGESGVVEGDFTDKNATIAEKVQETSATSVECYLRVTGCVDSDSDTWDIVYEQDFDLSIVQPKVSIVSGVPTSPVMAGSKLEVQVKAEGLRTGEEYYVSLSGLTDGPGDVQEANITEGGIVTLTGRASEYADKEACFWVYLYKKGQDGEGDEDVACAESSTFEVKAKVEFGLNWTPVDKVVAGKSYPFSVTIKNISGEDLSNLRLHVYSPRHSDDVPPWEADIDYTLPDDGNMKMDEYGVVIEKINAGDTINIEGTIVFPEKAVGDRSHLASYLSEIVDESDNAEVLIANDDTRDHQFQIVSGKSNNQGSNTSGENGNGQNGTSQTDSTKVSVKQAAARTGDTAPIVGAFAALLVSMTVIALMMRKKARG